MTGMAPNRKPVSVLTVAAAAVIASWWAIMPADAHGGGSAIFDGRAGPYQVFAYDGEATDQPDEIAYTAIVRDAAGGTPVDDAEVTAAARSTVTATSVSRDIPPVEATSVANVYRYVLPDPGDGRWEVTLTVEGDAGTGTATFEVHGLTSQAPAQQPDGADLVWLPIAAVGAFLVLSVGYLIIKELRRNPRSSSTTEAGT